MGVLVTVCLLDCNSWRNGKSLVLDRNAAVPILLNSMIIDQNVYFDTDLQRGREGIETLEGKISAVTLLEEIKKR